MSASDAVTVVKALGQAAGLAVGLIEWKRYRVEEKKRIWADVYRALSRHPILKRMHPNYPDPSSKWDGLDFYRQLVVQSKKHTIFTDASKLGETGAKAKIILLLLWIIVQHLPKGMEVESVVSRAITTEADTYGEPLSAVAYFSEVVGDMAKLFKNPLPSEIQKTLDRLTPPRAKADKTDESKHFYTTFLKGFRQCTLPSGYHHHEYDLSRKPHALLEKHLGFIMAPKNEQTERVMAWCIYKLHLGQSFKSSDTKKVNAAFAWIAALPPIKRNPKRRATAKVAPTPSIRKVRRKSTGPRHSQVVYGMRGRLPPTRLSSLGNVPPLTSLPVLQPAHPIATTPIELPLESLQAGPATEGLKSPGRRSVIAPNQKLSSDCHSESPEEALPIASSLLAYHPALTHVPVRLPGWANNILPIFNVVPRAEPEASNSRQTRSTTLVAMLWTIAIFLQEDQIVSLVSSIMEDCLRTMQDRAEVENHEGTNAAGAHELPSLYENLLALETAIKALTDIIINSRFSGSFLVSTSAHDYPLPEYIQSFLRAAEARRNSSCSDDSDRCLLHAISDTFGDSDDLNEDYELDYDCDSDLDDFELAEDDESSRREPQININIQTNPAFLFRLHDLDTVVVAANPLTRSVMKTLIDDFGVGIRRDNREETNPEVKYLWAADIEDEREGEKILANSYTEGQDESQSAGPS